MTNHPATHWIQDLQKALLLTSCRVVGKPVDISQGFDVLESLWLAVRSRGGAVWWVGNGGSCAICSHLSQDAMNKLHLRSQTLFDPALLTCMANDYGYSNVYAHPLQTLAKKGDLLVAISSSGKSENILKPSELAKEIGMSLVTLSAFRDDNPLWMLDADVAFHVSTTLYGQAEVAHHALLHASLECLWQKEHQGVKG